jgi:hypothetical protein
LVPEVVSVLVVGLDDTDQESRRVALGDGELLDGGGERRRVRRLERHRDRLEGDARRLAARRHALVRGAHQQLVLLAHLEAALREHLAVLRVDAEAALAASRLDAVLDLAVASGVRVHCQHLRTPKKPRGARSVAAPKDNKAGQTPTQFDGGKKSRAHACQQHNTREPQFKTNEQKKTLHQKTQKPLVPIKSD